MPPVIMHAVVLLANLFVAAAWTSAVLAISIAACLRLLPGISAKLRSSLWISTFAVAIILPLAMLGHGQAGRAMPESHLRLNMMWALPLVAVWALLSMYRAYGLLAGTLHLRALKRRAVQTRHVQSLSALLSDVKRTRWSRRVQVLLSREVDRPCVIGYLCPTILLPEAVLEDASEVDLQQILLHEFEHVQRFDDCTNLLQKLGTSLFPFSPALLWMERRLCLERELACDDAVLRVTGAPKAYAACLTHLAEGLLSRKAAALAVAALGRRSDLSRRVYRILQSPPRAHRRFVCRTASAVLLCGLGAGTAALAHLGSPIVFGDNPQAVAAVESGGIRATAIPATAQDRSSARLVRTNFVVRDRSAGRRMLSHLNRAAVKAGNTRRTRTPAALKARRIERLTSMPLEQMIGYAAEPQGRDTVPAFQQVSMPYAVIPTGNGWLVVQL